MSHKFKPNLGKPHNRKLGPDIWTWSIPAGLTCPGATKACLSCCYALTGMFTMPDVSKSYHLNWQAAASDKFVHWAINEIRRKNISVFRIHVSGDFFSPKYANKWVKIVKALPHVTFYAYTRSWRVKSIVPVLKKLSALRNMHLWLSADVDTGKPIRISRARVAWMSRNEAEHQHIPGNTNLVFRNHTSTVLKSIANARVCPVENGVTLRTPLTCSKCRICFSSQKRTSPHSKGNANAMFSCRQPTPTRSRGRRLTAV